MCFTQAGIVKLGLFKALSVNGLHSSWGNRMRGLRDSVCVMLSEVNTLTEVALVYRAFPKMYTHFRTGVGNRFHLRATSNLFKSSKGRTMNTYQDFPLHFRPILTVAIFTTDPTFTTSPENITELYICKCNW